MRFEHTHDGMVVVDGDTGYRYFDSSANFAVDSPATALPPAGVIYIPGKVNAVAGAVQPIDGEGVPVPAVADTAAMDAALANAQALVTAQLARRAAAMPAPQPQLITMAELDRKSIALIRAYLAAEAAAPQALKDIEAQYQTLIAQVQKA